MDFPKKLLQKLQERTEKDLLRTLKEVPNNAIDFCSNDYLGIGKQNFESPSKQASTGSRLISGTDTAHTRCETFIAENLHAEAALLFNSGYAANTGLLSAILSKEDLVLYDKNCHASIRDGIQISHAKSYSFEHNNLAALEQKLKLCEEKTCYVIIESHYSMEGDATPLKEITALCKKNKAYLIVDEAHSLAWYGVKGKGLTVDLGLENDVFARVYTFGKGLGYHGAAVLGSKNLNHFLINFSRPFIYTTAVSPKDAHIIEQKFTKMLSADDERKLLHENIRHFKTEAEDFKHLLIASDSPIQAIMLGSNKAVDCLQKHLEKNQYFLKGIKHPTVAQGTERMRIVLHSYNTKAEISALCTTIKDYLK